MDNTELGQTEEDLIVDLEMQLNLPKFAASILESVREIYHEEKLTSAQKKEADRLIQDLSTLHTKAAPKMSLKEQIASADSRRTDSNPNSQALGRDGEPERS